MYVGIYLFLYNATQQDWHLVVIASENDSTRYFALALIPFDACLISYNDRNQRERDISLFWWYLVQSLARTMARYPRYCLLSTPTPEASGRLDVSIGFDCPLYQVFFAPRLSQLYRIFLRSD